MGRTALDVRAATIEDLPDLLAFGEELRDQLLMPADGTRSRGVSSAARAALEQRYRDAIADPMRHLVVVTGEDEALGMALFTVAPSNALLDLPAVHVSHAVVADRHKRRGAGKALVVAAVSFAEERHLEQVVISVHPGSRDANRFFARLGFAPLAVRRVAPVSLVRWRLAQLESRPVDAPPRGPRRRVRLPRIALGAADSES